MVQRRIALINQKGGVGKTTLAANLSAFWGRQGRRVLALDLDPQAHLSIHFGLAVEQPLLYQVLRGEIPVEEAILHVKDDNFDLVPASIHMSGIDIELGQELGREMLLRDRLGEFSSSDRYDLVVIDCPPSLGLLSLNALTAVDEVVIPVQAEFFALQGIAQLIHVVEKVQKRLHPQLRWRAIVPTLLDARTLLGREVVADLRKHFPTKVTEACIWKRIKIAEAPSMGKSIFQYAPNSESAADFERLAKELELRLGLFASASPPADREPGEGISPTARTREPLGS